MIVGGFLRTLRRLYCMSVELGAFLVVHSDFRWNCVRIQQFIVIASGIGVVISSLL